MDPSRDRRRSTSVGRQPQQMMNHPAVTSPQFINDATRLSMDPAMRASMSVFNPAISGPQTSGQYNFRGDFINPSVEGISFQQHTVPSNDFADPAFGQQVYRPQRNSLSNGQHPMAGQPGLQQPGSQYPSDSMGATFATPFTDPFRQQHEAAAKQDMLMLDSTMTMTSPPPSQSINPADIMGGMAGSPNHLSQQGLMAFDNRSPPGRSPSPQQNQFHTPAHSRNVSLDPASAGFQQGMQTTDWTNMMSGPAFQSHRRAPSEHSEVSSVAPSPFLQQQESFESYDHQNRSPMLTAQHDDPLYNGAFGIEGFTISDAQQEQQRRANSPGHSPYVSPRMSPHQGLGISQDPQFVLPSNDGMSTPFNGTAGSQAFNGSMDSGLPKFQVQHEVNDMGQAASMAPPSISIDPAPPSQQNFQLSIVPVEHDPDNTLSPPERGRRNRIRAKSDPSYNPSSRSISPCSDTSPSAPLSPPTTSGMRPRQRSLSPFDNPYPPSLSRDPSPAPGSGSGKLSRRSSTSSVHDRNYIITLANPDRTTSSGADRQGRIQKHPATFQCTLCPKRFTRAYNLRSHLRTHGDERPFVCTVCGKAFARQHDRKRHEGLHSGEKKFVCRGELSDGGQWGCGRRFARADALGRHFRSEAGRVCIKPLLDEEAAERQRLYEEQLLAQQQASGQAQAAMAAPLLDMSPGPFTLPAALLAQYPALQGIQWDQLGQGPGSGGAGGDGADGSGFEGERSGRSSFDGSGGDFGELEGVGDEDGEGGMEGGYVSGPGTGFGGSWGVQGGHDWASDYEGR